MKAWAGAPRLRRPASPRHTIASRRRLHGPRADDWRQSQVHDPAAVERRLPGLSWRKVRRYTMMTVRLLPHGKVHEKAQPCGSTRGGSERNESVTLWAAVHARGVARGGVR